MLEKALSFNRWTGCVLKEDASEQSSEDQSIDAQKAGHLILPALSYKSRNLGGALSRRAIETHMLLHKKYVDKTRELVAGTDLAEMHLGDVIRKAAEDKTSDLFLNASQAWNHAFYWMSISPPGKDTSPTRKLLEAVKSEFGGVDECREEMAKEAAKLFGSGWLWMVKVGDKPQILLSKDATNPLIKKDLKPIFCIDLWEHAYFLDYMGDRRAYIDVAVRGLLNWGFADRNWER